MTTSTCLGITLSACLLGLYAVLDAVPEEARTLPPRADAELCAEVTIELQRSAQQGLLTQQEAQAISERCYEIQ